MDKAIAAMVFLLSGYLGTKLILFLQSHAASASIVFTADEAVRGGKTIPLKAMVDEALEGCDCVKKVFVSKRTGANVPMYDRDVLLEEVGK